MTKAILINYEYCTGCHSCEVACKKHLELPEGEFGIKLTEVGPYEYNGKIGPEHWEWSWLPVLTKACDMCTDRTEKGKMPMCVQHCQAWCMYYGEADDLAKKMDGKTRWSLFTAADKDMNTSASPSARTENITESELERARKVVNDAADIA